MFAIIIRILYQLLMIMKVLVVMIEMHMVMNNKWSLQYAYNIYADIMISFFIDLLILNKYTIGDKLFTAKNLVHGSYFQHYWYS